MNRKSMVAAVALAGALAVPFAAWAQGKDELWEVSSQMNVPGMPAGMGAMTQRICQDKDPGKQTMQGQNMQNCKITDMKQSGTRVTLTVTCPDSRAVIEQNYNAARTEYKGTMRMTGRDGDMTMTMSGRKVGSCDAQQARRQQDAQQAAMKSDMERMQAQSAAHTKRSQEEAIRSCTQAVETMEVEKLGVFGQCKEQPELCKGYASAGMDPGNRAEKSCSASRAQLCARYETPEGFLTAKGAERTAKFCGVDAQTVKASLCPQAASTDSLVFMARFCPVEAKPLAQQHCAGRNFTAMRVDGKTGNDKYFDFCLTYLANADLHEPRTQEAQQKTNPADAVRQGIGQGINKLKGLFGR